MCEKVNWKRTENNLEDPTRVDWPLFAEIWWDNHSVKATSGDWGFCESFHRTHCKRTHCDLDYPAYITCFECCVSRERRYINNYVRMLSCFIMKEWFIIFWSAGKFKAYRYTKRMDYTFHMLWWCTFSWVNYNKTFSSAVSYSWPDVI